jgi:hypothetical protein
MKLQMLMTDGALLLLDGQMCGVLKVLGNLNVSLQMNISAGCAFTSTCRTGRLHFLI